MGDPFSRARMLASMMGRGSLAPTDIDMQRLRGPATQMPNAAFGSTDINMNRLGGAPTAMGATEMGPTSIGSPAAQPPTLRPYSPPRLDYPSPEPLRAPYAPPQALPVPPIDGMTPNSPVPGAPQGQLQSGVARGLLGEPASPLARTGGALDPGMGKPPMRNITPPGAQRGMPPVGAPGAQPESRWLGPNANGAGSPMGLAILAGLATGDSAFHKGIGDGSLSGETTPDPGLWSDLNGGRNKLAEEGALTRSAMDPIETFPQGDAADAPPFPTMGDNVNNMMDLTDGASGIPSPSSPYRVQRGDTLTGLTGQQLGVAPTNRMAQAMAKALAAGNGIADPNKIDVGQEIDLSKVDPTVLATTLQGSGPVFPRQQDRKSLEGITTQAMTAANEYQGRLDSADQTPSIPATSSSTPMFDGIMGNLIGKPNNSMKSFGVRGRGGF